jgi:branched-chain amino acid transport system substrate-binding protein
MSTGDDGADDDRKDTREARLAQPLETELGSPTLLSDPSPAAKQWTRPVPANKQRNRRAVLVVVGIALGLIAAVGIAIPMLKLDAMLGLKNEQSAPVLGPTTVAPIVARAQDDSGERTSIEIENPPKVDRGPVGRVKTSSPLSANAASPMVAQAVSPTPGAPVTAAPTPGSAPTAASAPTLTSALIPTPVAAAVRGVTDTEIRFGLVGPFSGPARELGRQMKLGIECAFDQANEAGGIHGRQLRLIASDDGYEPTRTEAVMQQLYDKNQVFGFVGNVGTPTAAVALPFALDHRMVFFGAFTGAGLLRRDPPDRYVFNYRASYEEETEAVVRYLVKVRRIQPNEIAVFAQQDSFGDSGFAGVSKAVRALPGDNSTIVRLGYKRNTIDVTDAVSQLRLLRPQPKAVVMVATYRAAAKFIEKTKDLIPGMLYTNVSFVGSTALSEELMLLGPRFATGVVVTQVVPAVNSYASVILKYKSALEKSFPGEAPDYVSLEGYIEANILIEALKRTGPHLDSEALVDQLETMRNYDIGLGSTVNFSPSDHQGVHKVWGTEIDAAGRYQPIDMK